MCQLAPFRIATLCAKFLSDTVLVSAFDDVSALASSPFEGFLEGEPPQATKAMAQNASKRVRPMVSVVARGLMELKYPVMTYEETSKSSKSDVPRTREEVTDFNDRVWDMVLRKIHVVAFYVLVQIVLVSFFQTHPAMYSWGTELYLGQFLGAWTVFYGTLLRDMGFRSYSGGLLMALGVLSLLPPLFTDPLAWSDRAVHGILLLQVVPGTLLWALTLYRWRILKRQYLAAQEEGVLP